jgi:hypothetical protein
MSKFSGNVLKQKSVSVRGVGKSQATSPSRTHRVGGAVLSPKPAKGVFDNRGPRGHRVRKMP